jgi:cytochrome c-type biogenesis protein CcmH
LLLALQFTPQLPNGTAPLDPAAEVRVQRLGKQLRCVVCQGLSIADSPASTARSQLDKVRQLVQEGKSDQEIYDYFVARYGDWVLLSPKPEGFNLIVWLAPAILLSIGLGLILRTARRRAPSGGPAVAQRAGMASETASTSAPTSAASPADARGSATTPEDPYLRAIQRELGND